MKKNIFPFLILSCAAMTVSCSDFLTEDPKGQMTIENYFGSQSELDGAVNALMAQVQHSLGDAHASAPNWMGDDITTQVSSKDVFKEFDIFDVKDNNADTKVAWNKNFSIIKAANFIINNASKTPVSEEEIKIGLGQGYFWRAVAYLKLVRWYGSVPLILTTDIDFNVEKSSIDKIYERICEDLRLAIEYLPEKFEKEPRISNGLNNYANKGAAEAVQVAAYMARAGFPLNQNEYYAKAADLARQIIEKTSNSKYYYKLEDNFKDKYMYVTNNYSQEGVVAVKFNMNNPWGWSGLDSWLSACHAYNSVTNGGWGDALAEIKYWKDMPDGPRKTAIYGENGKIFVEKGEKANTLIDWYEKDNGNFICSEAHPMFRTLLYGGGKDGNTMGDYNDKSTTWNSGICSQTLYMITYNEILLWYAEAKARSGSIDELAKTSLQKILDRAYGTDVQKASDYISSPDMFAEKCLQEHGFEVAGYFPALVSRANDLLRMNRLKDVFEMRKQNAAIEVANGITMTEPISVSGSWNDNRNYATIPSFDSDLNDSLKK